MTDNPYHPAWKEFQGVRGVGSNVNQYSGKLIKVDVKDPHADALANRINGQSRVRFENDSIVKREFDAISDDFIAQAKPNSVGFGKKFRDQAKATFEAALASNRKVYYHFQGGNPSTEVIKRLHEYSARYNVPLIIDTTPLKF